MAQVVLFPSSDLDKLHRDGERPLAVKRIEKFGEGRENVISGALQFLLATSSTHTGHEVNEGFFVTSILFALIEVCDEENGRG